MTRAHSRRPAAPRPAAASVAARCALLLLLLPVGLCRAAEYASLGAGLCASNQTVVKACLYLFADQLAESCPRACDDAPAVGQNTCVGFAATHSAATNTTECYLYGYGATCPVVDNDPGIALGIASYLDIDNVLYTGGFGTFECILKTSFVEANGIAFTSVNERQLCLESPNFCDALSCYDCGCVSPDGGLLGVEKICASSQDRADASIPARTLQSLDHCDLTCQNMDGQTLPEEPDPTDEDYFVRVGDGLCAAPPTAVGGDPTTIQSCLYTHVESELDCAILCTSYTGSELALIFGTECFGFYFFKEPSSSGECMLYGLESYCPYLEGRTGSLLSGSMHYTTMTTSLPNTTCTDCTSSGCMVNRWFAENYVVSYGPQVGAAFASVVLALAALLGLIYWKARVRKPPAGVDLGGDEFEQDFYRTVNE